MLRRQLPRQVVIKCSLIVPEAGHGSTNLRVHSQLMGDAEICDNHVQRGCGGDQDVCRAKVTMDDA